MNKVLKIFSTAVIILFVLSVFGWMVDQISNKNKSFGILTEPIKFMYSFPDLFNESVEEVKTLPRTYIHTPTKFKSVNKLKKDLIVLITHSDEGDKRTVKLLNLRNDSIFREWTLDNPWDEVARIVNTIYLENGSLIYNYYYKGRPGLVRLDSVGNTLWKNDSLVIHHGMNLGSDGHIWTCSVLRGAASGFYTRDGKKNFYDDNRITKFDVSSGEILFDKSVTEILVENNLSNYILKSSALDDPLHLNDIKPALKTTDSFNEDDLFISLRNISCVIHYRPSSNELIQIIEGPFINQHDVDFLNDSTLTIFNNNTYVDKSRPPQEPHNLDWRLKDAGSFYSNIVSYDLKNDVFEFIGQNVFQRNTIFTLNEGLAEPLAPDTFFIEEQNSGKLWVISGEEVIYKNVLNSQHEGYHHLPNWTRIVSYR
ncbi:MAG: arylsulfotransferase family protein [Bacteroidota bacterium]